jgi:hypothetical protein
MSAMARAPRSPNVRRIAVGGLALAAALTGCSEGSDRSTVATSTTAGPAATERCVVRLHGKGGQGAATVVDDEVSVIAPDGNAEGWGARQWLYFPDGEYTSARDTVDAAIDGCGQLIVNGFSNGGAFAAKLYCRGETFDGRLTRVVVDDPVVDHAADACTPDPSVDLTLYWTGALEPQAQPGWDCTEADWTCEGGRTIGIDAYAEALRTQPKQSPFDDHQWHTEAPELSAWP